MSGVLSLIVCWNSELWFSLLIFGSFLGSIGCIDFEQSIFGTSFCLDSVKLFTCCMNFGSNSLILVFINIFPLLRGLIYSLLLFLIKLIKFLISSSLIMLYLSYCEVTLFSSPQSGKMTQFYQFHFLKPESFGKHSFLFQESISKSLTFLLLTEVRLTLFELFSYNYFELFGAYIVHISSTDLGWLINPSIFFIYLS